MDRKEYIKRLAMRVCSLLSDQYDDEENLIDDTQRLAIELYNLDVENEHSCVVAAMESLCSYCADLLEEM